MESGLEREDDSFLQLFCYCHFVIRQDRSRSAGFQNPFFLVPGSQGRSSVPSSALLCVGNLVNIRSTQKLSWIPLFHATSLSDRNDPLWECWYNLSNLTNQRVYQELVHRNGLSKEMITGSAAPSLPSFLLFYFHLRALSIQRAQLFRSLEEATSSRTTNSVRSILGSQYSIGNPTLSHVQLFENHIKRARLLFFWNKLSVPIWSPWEPNLTHRRQLSLREVESEFLPLLVFFSIFSE